MRQVYRAKPTLAAERRRLGFSQRALAATTGYTGGAIGHLETGRMAASVDGAERIASALGGTVADLFEPDDTRQGERTDLKAAQ